MYSSPAASSSPRGWKEKSWEPATGKLRTWKREAKRTASAFPLRAHLPALGGAAGSRKHRPRPLTRMRCIPSSAARSYPVGSLPAQRRWVLACTTCSAGALASQAAVTPVTRSGPGYSLRRPGFQVWPWSWDWSLLPPAGRSETGRGPGYNGDSGAQTIFNQRRDSFI